MMDSSQNEAWFMKTKWKFQIRHCFDGINCVYSSLANVMNKKGYKRGDCRIVSQ
jgi:hypothetical protein